MSKNRNYEEGKIIITQSMNKLSITGNNDKSVFLFLLHFCRHKLFLDYQCDYFNEVNCMQHIEKVLMNGAVENIEILRELTIVFNQELLMINNTRSTLFFDIICPLLEISDDWYNKYYTTIFEELILNIDSNQDSNLYLQPVEITKLISKLIGYNQNEKVYNPFAGAASYAVELKPFSKYFGQEINRRIWAIGTLRLLANKINSEKYICQNSIHNWPTKINENDDLKLMYDLIISTPPFGVKMDFETSWNIPIQQKYTIEEIFILRGLEALMPKGKLIGVFSSFVLFKGGSADFVRRFVVDNDFLETVISLPSNLFSNTAISTVILIFSKSKEIKQNVKFVDGSIFFKKVKRNNILDFEQILHNLNSQNNKFVRNISTKEIIENDYILSVGRYFFNKLKDIQIPNGYKLVKLSNLTTIYHCEKSKNSFGKIISFEDLASDPFNYQKKISDLEIEEVPDGFQKISSNVLLLSKNRSLKPTYCIVDEGSFFYCSNNLISLEVDNTKIDIDYLIYELNSERVEKYVLSKYAIGISIPTIRTIDLLEIPILLPSRIKQKVIVADAIRKYQEKKINELGFKIDELKDLRRETYEQNMHLRKHALTQVLNSLAPAFSRLNDTFKKNDGVLRFNEIVSSKTNRSVEDYFNNIEQNINKLVNLINCLVDNQEFGERDIVYIEKFLEDYSHKHIDPDFKIVFSHQLQKESLDYNFSGGYIKYPDGSEEFIEDLNISAGDERYSYAISICPKDLEQILDNLLSNAKIHGFTDFKRNDYEVRLSLHEDIENNRIIICVANNGNPLPEGMDSEKFFKWGVGSHTGLGSWQVKNIAEHFDGEVTLKEYNDDPFPIEIQLSFPLTNIF